MFCCSRPLLPISTGACLLFHCSFSIATPSDLADLSLQDLLRLEIHDDPFPVETLKERWTIEYSFRQLKLNGYQMADRSVGLEQIFQAAGEPRTAMNFPVVPIKATQEVHTFDISYRMNDRLKISLSVPLVKQNTEHVSSVPGFERFAIQSSGIGDVSFFSHWYQPLNAHSALQLSFGLSIPTGSIDEKGDTPRNGAGTLEQLPFTKQLGSGTWDLPMALSYLRHDGSWDWGVQATARIHLGRNHHNYHLGDRYGINVWAQYFTKSYFHPGVRVAWQHINPIDGIDTELLMPGQFRFPSPISNPDFYGGNNVNLSLLMKVCNSETNCKKYADLEFTRPVYRNMTGIQPREDYQFRISFGLKF